MEKKYKDEINNLNIEKIKKANGSAKFTDDFFFKNMLFVKLKRSKNVNVKIKSINLKKAKKINGVVCILTGIDFKNKYGIMPLSMDEIPICLSKIRFIGDIVAAVAAVSNSSAELGVNMIEVIYEKIKYVKNFKYRKKNKVIINNVFKNNNVEFGNSNKILNNSDIYIENNFFYYDNTYSMLEPYCAISSYDCFGKLLVISTTKVPHYLKYFLSKVLNLNISFINVLKPFVGKKNNCKIETFALEFIVSKFSILTKHPIKCLCTEEEVFYANRDRYKIKVKLGVGCNKLGGINFINSSININNIEYFFFNIITTYYSCQLNLISFFLNGHKFNSIKFLKNKLFFKNYSYYIAKSVFYLEIMLDILSDKLGIDPIEIRKRNFIKENGKLINGLNLGYYGLDKCLNSVISKSNWYKNINKFKFGRGLGIATSICVIGSNFPIFYDNLPETSVKIEINKFGINVSYGLFDIGKGCNNILINIICDKLGVNEKSITIVNSRFDLNNIYLYPYYSKVTKILILALLESLDKIKKKMIVSIILFFKKIKKLEKIKNLKFSDFLFNNNIILINKYNLSINFKNAIKLTKEKYGFIKEVGNYIEKIRGESYVDNIVGSSLEHYSAAHVVDLEVDIKTGLIKINKIWVAHDCGKSIDNNLIRNKIIGDIYVGFSECIFEKLIFSKINNNLVDCKLPTNLYVPNIEEIIIEKNKNNKIFKLKDIDKIKLHSSVPAIINAIHNAVGVRISKIPLNFNYLLNKLK